MGLGDSLALRVGLLHEAKAKVIINEVKTKLNAKKKAKNPSKLNEKAFKFLYSLDIMAIQVQPSFLF